MDLAHGQASAMLRIVATAVGIGLVATFYIGGKSPDFTVFHAAAVGWPGQVYDLDYLRSLQGGKQYPWAYPPTFLLMVLPLRFLDMEGAYVAWVALTGTAFLESVRLLAGRWAWAAVLSPGVFLAAAMGQSTLLVGALVVGGLALKDRAWLAGGLLGVAACIKPQLLLLAPIGLLSAGRWRELLGMGLTGLGLCAMSALMLGLDAWRAWLAALPGFIALNHAMGLPGIAPQDPWLRGVLAVCSVALTWRAFGSEDRNLQILTAFGGVVLFSEHMMRYDLVIAAAASLGMARKYVMAIPPALIFLSYLISDWIGILIYIVVMTLIAVLSERRQRVT